MKVRFSVLVVLSTLASLTGCGGGSGGAGPQHVVTVTATPTATATATVTSTPTVAPKKLDCRSILSLAEVRRLAAHKVGKPVVTDLGQVEGCEWFSGDGKVQFGAASLPAGAWVRALPTVIDSARAVLRRSAKGKKAISTLERLLKERRYRTDRQGCDLFRIYIHALYNTSDGVDVVIFYLPGKGKTQSVAGQSCVNGHYRSLVYSQVDGIDDRETVGRRLEDALVAASL